MGGHAAELVARDEGGASAQIAGAERGDQTRRSAAHHQDVYLGLLHVRRSASQRRARSPGMKQYSPPRVTTKRGNPRSSLGIGFLRDRVPAVPVVGARDGILHVAEAQEVPAVDPLGLHELELPPEVGADEGEHQAAIAAVVVERPRGELGSIRRSAANHAVQPDDAGHGGVARVRAPDVRPGRRAVTRRIVREAEVVVARADRRPTRGHRGRGTVPAARRCASAPSSSPPGAPHRRGRGRCPSGTGGRPPRAGAACGTRRRCRCVPAPRAWARRAMPPVSSV